MSEFLSKFNGGELIGLAAVLGTFVCGTVAIMMGIWHATKTAEIAASLKRDMISKGMTADEICSVINAGATQSRHQCRKQLRRESVSDYPREPSPDSYRAAR